MTRTVRKARVTSWPGDAKAAEVIWADRPGGQFFVRYPSDSPEARGAVVAYEADEFIEVEVEGEPAVYPAKVTSIEREAKGLIVRIDIFEPGS